MDLARAMVSSVRLSRSCSDMISVTARSSRIDSAVRENAWDADSKSRNRISGVRQIDAAIAASQGARPIDGLRLGAAFLAPQTELLLHRPVGKAEQHEIAVRPELAPRPGRRHEHVLLRHLKRCIPDDHRAGAFGH